MADLSAHLRRVVARLTSADVAGAAFAAMHAEGEQLARDIQASLSNAPGSEHEAPWRRSGTLEISVGAETGGAEVVVGSSDPVAVDQELGTRTVPPRPFLGPAAAGASARIAEIVGDAAASALRQAMTGELF